jgi:hypothetical protein
MALWNYILDDKGEPILEPDDAKWAKWFEENFFKRGVKDDDVDHFRVSTSFNGIDHAFWNEEGGPPVVWQTMVFDLSRGEEDRWTEIEKDHCAGNREQAEAMHEAMVQKYRSKI